MLYYHTKLSAPGVASVISALQFGMPDVPYFEPGNGADI
jgi:hypothetical protein